MNAQDAQARALADELRQTRAALAAVLREVQAVKADTAHTSAVLVATRRELSELRVKRSDEPGAVTRLIQRATYKPPTPIVKFAKDVKAGARVFLAGRESLNGTVQHVVIARDANGNIYNLPDGCSYDKARRFVGMATPNRRLYWRGKRTIYTGMLALCERVGIIERKGRRYRWADRYDLAARAGWVSQWRPPHRVR